MLRQFKEVKHNKIKNLQRLQIYIVGGLEKNNYKINGII